MGLSVVVVCGTVEEAEQTCDLIREKTKKAKSKRSELIPRGADLRKGKEVVKLVAGLGDLEVRCVVHCAGVFGVSCEKFADVIGVNAAAPFLLTELLVERRRGQKNKNNKKYAPPLRLVFVGSFTHRGVTVSQVMRVWESLLTDCGKGGKDLRDKGNKDISDKNKAARLTPAEVYAFSKLAVTSFAYVFSTRYESVSIGDESLSHNSSRSESRKETEEEHEHVTCAVADPGLVDTKINRGWPFTLRVSYVFVASAVGLLATPTQAARAVCGACFREETVISPKESKEPKEGFGDTRKEKQNCTYFFGPRGARLEPSPLVLNPEVQKITKQALEHWMEWYKEE